MDSRGFGLDLIFEKVFCSYFVHGNGFFGYIYTCEKEFFFDFAFLRYIHIKL